MSRAALRAEALARAAIDLRAQAGQRTTLPVEGWSMWPVLRPGQRLVIRSAGAPPVFGDVAVIRVDGRTIAHRVIGACATANGVYLRLKGDFNLLADGGWASPGSLLGVAEALEIDGKPAGRFGLGGRGARLIAALSRAQGFLCAPLTPLIPLVRRVRRWATSGQTSGHGG
jgi:hypothetical protein